MLPSNPFKPGAPVKPLYPGIPGLPDSPLKPLNIKEKQKHINTQFYQIYIVVQRLRMYILGPMSLIF